VNVLAIFLGRGFGSALDWRRGWHSATRALKHGRRGTAQAFPSLRQQGPQPMRTAPALSAISTGRDEISAVSASLS